MTKKNGSPLTELFNEKQETIFNTALSEAADNFTKANLEVEGWKKKRLNAESALIAEMKKSKLTLINLPQNRQLRISHQDEKYKIIIKDVKPKMPRRKRNF